MLNLLKTFTKEEKDACLQIVDLLLDAANTARKNGVLALEEFVKNKNNDFFTFATMLVVDGTDPVLVKNIIEKLIYADDHKGSALLERILLMEGVLSIQAGENPRLIEAKLLSMLGEAYLKKRGHINFGSPGEGIIYEDNPMSHIKELLNKEILPEWADFNKTLLVFSNRDLQCILREIDQNDLAIALRGASEEAAKKLLDNLSARLALTILEKMAWMGPLKTNDITEAQGKITKVIERLTKFGETIFSQGELKTSPSPLP